MKIENYFDQSRLSSYQDYLRSQNLSPATINRKLSSISVFKKFLTKKKYLEPTSSPVPQSPLPPFNKGGKPNIVSLVKGRFRGIENFNRYLIFSTLLILLAGLTYGLYSQTILKARKNLAYSTASSPIRPGRVLSFQGRLTDSAGNPITSSTGIVFKLWDNATVGLGTSLYTSSIGNSATVTPDDNGIFNVVIGKTHGSEIPPSVFSENAEVWLEITAGNEVMDPRQQIATVAYALNSETIQGLSIGTSGIGYKNTVAVFDNSGNLNLGETSPSIVSRSGTFGIEGQAMLLKATDSSGGNITINPDAAGIIKLISEGAGSTAVGGFIEATNANLATGNLYSGFINNDNRGYNFLSFANYDLGSTQLTTRFSVGASGNVYISGTTTLAGLAIGTTGAGSTAVFTDVNGNLYKNILGAGAFGTGIGTTYSFTNGLTNGSNTITLGGTLTQNTRLNIGNTEAFYIAYPSGNVGIGTTGPTEKLSLYQSSDTEGLKIYGYDDRSTSYMHSYISSTGHFYQDTSADWHIRPFGTEIAIMDSSRFRLADNKSLNFGTSSDFVILYDETTDDRLEMTDGTNLFLAVKDQGTAADFNFNNGNVFIKNDGNVGIGTTAPLAKFHVEGQCVTGDTLLKKRRKKKKNGKWVDEWLDTPIKDIKPGDEILTLDEKTGKFVPSIVEKLMDMGVQQTYLLITKSGKSIRTTANHPYLVRSAQKVEISGGTFQVDQSPRMENLTQDSFVAIANKNIHFIIRISKEYKQKVYQEYRNQNRLRFFASDVFGQAIGALLLNSKIEPSVLQIDLENPGYQSRINQTIKHIANSQASFDHQSLGHQATSYAHWAAYRAFKKEYQPNIEVVPELPKTKNDRGTNKLVGQGVVTLIALNQIRNTRDQFNQLYQLPLELSNQASWKKVIAIKPGMELATVDGWEKIVAIKEFTREQTYDIQVANTHNFVGNEIVAHNTYINGNLGIGISSPIGPLQVNIGNTQALAITTAGNVGIGTTNPGAKLEVFGSALFGQNSGSNNIKIYSEYLSVGFTGNDSELSFKHGGFDRIKLTSDQITAGSNDFDFKIKTLDAGASGYNDWFTIKGTNGNVGIGTTNPTYKLQVGGTGSLGVGGTINFSGLGLGATGAGTTAVFIDGSGNLSKNILGTLAFGNVYTFNNGLTETSRTVGLGGTLTQNTNITIGNTSIIYLSTGGNLGVGTTNPLQKLHVEGQCVTGDTLLKRKKKKKNADDEDEFEDIRIDEIEVGDEILTLDEKTGKFVPSIVEKLMDMGVQPIFTLITQSGKRIRTTSNHPYLVLPKNKAKIKSSTFEVDQSYRIEDLHHDTIVAVANKFQPYAIRISKKEKVSFYQDYQKANRIKLFGPEIFAKSIISLVLKYQIPVSQLIIDEEYTNRKLYISSIIKKQLPQIDDVHFQSIGHSSPAHNFAYNLATNEKRTLTGSKLKGFPVAELHHQEWLPGFESPHGPLSKAIITPIWTKVKLLKAGITIATVDGWEKIETLYQSGKEQTYDIQVANTHNFVGNNIVAHNTYINGNLGIGISSPIGPLHINIGATPAFVVTSTGNIGIGTTSPGAKLDVNGGDIWNTTSSANYYLKINTNALATDSINFTGPFGYTFLQYDNDTGAVSGTYATTVGVSNGRVIMNGNVGIGTTNPLYKLDVNGDINTNSRIGIGGTDASFSFHTTSNGRFDTNLSVGGTTTLAGLAIGTTGTGTTAVFTDVNGNLYKNILGAGAFGNGVGTTYSVTNGLSVISTNVFGLGGTLTQNTRLNIGSTEAFYIAYPSGNVGIGTTGPSEKLEVAGNIRLNTGSVKVNQGQGIIDATANYGLYPQITATRLGIYTAGTEKFSIDSSGNVGIGTTGPNNLLEVVGGTGGSITDLLQLRSNTVTQNTATGINFINSTNASTSTAGRAEILSTRAGAAGETTLEFKTYTGTYGTRMYIDTSGNVGIGTTGPGAKLDIRSANVTPIGGYNVLGQLNIFSTDAQAIDKGGSITFGGFTDDAATTTRTFAAISGLKDSASTGSNRGYLAFGTDNSGGAMTERMRIDSDGKITLGGSPTVTGTGNVIFNTTGNVGIGTTNPGYKLHVVGEIFTSTKIGIGATHATYNLFVSSGGIGVTGASSFSGNLGIGGTLTLSASTVVGSGTTALFIDSNNVVSRRGLGALAFQDSTASTYNWIANASAGQNIGDGSTLSFTGTNGLTTTSVGTSQITFGLGGTLTTNTFINTGTNNLYIMGVNSNTQALAITTGGNVGIGTTNPLYKLHIQGGNIYVADLGTGQTDPTTAKLVFDSTYDHAGATTANKIVLYDSASWKGGFGISNNDIDLFSGGNFRFYTAHTQSVEGTEALTILQSGSVGIGTTNPLYKLHIPSGGLLVDRIGIGSTSTTYELNITGDGYFSTNLTIGGTFVSVGSTNLVTNLNADVFDGTHLSTLSESLRSNNNLTGGGTITLDAAYNLYWSARFIVIANGRGSDFSTNGYFDITVPGVGTTITGVGGAASRPVGIGTSGIALNIWEALYYILPIGSASTSLPANFRIATYNSDITIPHDWVLLAVRNGDNNHVRIGNGIILKASQSWDNSTNSSAFVPNADLLDGQHGSYYLDVGDTGNFIQNQFTADQTANLRISGSAMFGGKVGIGTTNSLYLLNVGGTANFTNLFTSGSVGIGTTSPLSKLQFSANNYASSPGAKTYTGSAINADGGDMALGRVFFQGSGSSGTDVVGINNETNRLVLYNYTDNRYLQIWEQAGDTYLAPTTGNVGIGTTNPLVKFVVAGDTTLAGDNGQIRIEGLTNSAKKLYLGVDTSAATSYGYIQSTESSVNARALSLNPSGGNVGIGTTNPTQPLTLTGNMLLTGGIMNNSAVNFLTSGSAAQGIKVGSIVVGNTYTGITAPSEGIIVNGSVGIGTTGPGGPLDVYDGTNRMLQVYDAGSVGNLFVTGGISTYNTTVTDGYVEASGLCLGDGTNCITDWGSTGEGRSQIETNRSIGGTAGNTVAVGYFSNDGIGKNIKMHLKSHTNGTIDVLTFEINDHAYLGTATNWLEIPLASGISYAGTRRLAVDVYRQDIASTSDPLYVRIRNKNGAGAGTVQVYIDYDDDSTLTELTSQSDIGTTFNVSTAPAGGAVTGIKGNVEWDFPVSNGNAWGTTGTYGIFIKNNGNVGIGTTGPSSTLHVNNTAVTDTTLLTLESDINQVGEYQQLLFNVVGGLNYGAIRNYISANGEGSLGFFGATASVLSSEVMRIQGNGNVGIGTTNPGAKLDVAGDFYFSGGNRNILSSNDLIVNPTGDFYIRKTPRVYVATAGEFQALILSNPQAAAAGYGSRLDFQGDTGWNTMASVTSVWEGASNDNSYLSFSTRASDSVGEKVRITSTGNVGIGTTAPTSLLAVGASSQFTVNSAGDITTSSTGELVIGGTGNSSIAGNLGIGITSPSYKLHVVGNGYFSTNLGVGSTATMATAYITGALLDKDAGAGSSGQVLKSTGTQVDWVDISSIGVGGSGTATYIPKFTAATTLGNSAIYDLNGNVGIGTTSPGEKLEIAGNIKLSGLSNSQNTYTYLASNYGLGLRNLANSSTSANQEILLDESATNLNTNPRPDPAGSTTGWSCWIVAGTCTTTNVADATMPGVGGRLIRLTNTGSTSQSTVLISNTTSITNTQDYLISFYAKGSVGGSVSLNIQSTTDWATISNTSSITLTTSWQKYVVKLTATRTDTGRVNFNKSVAASETVDVANVLEEARSYATTYFDGAMGTGYAWSGTAHNSQSTRATGTYFGTLTSKVAYINTSGDFTSSGLASFSGSGNNYFAGNVGIGTTAPDNKLVVNGSVVNATNLVGGLGTAARYWAQSYIYGVNLGSGQITDVSDILGYASTDLSIYAASGKLLKLGSNGTAGQMVINAGNVGIGTTGPSQKLQVAGIAQADTAFYVGTGAGTQGGDDNLIRPTAASSWLNIKGGAGKGKITLGNEIVRITGGDAGYTMFGYGASSSTNVGTDGMKFTTLGGLSLGAAYVGTDPGAGSMIISGNVGIGTTNPLQKLHVNGNCVVGSTMLPIRRRRRRKSTGLECEEEWDYLFERIDNVLPGDEVMSLNESNGLMEYARINKLMDMGIQDVFELTTKTGRKIRTTGNHPYLVQTDSTPLLVKGGVGERLESERFN